MWSERILGPGAGMVIHQIVVEWAHVWVWHEDPRDRQPTTPSQPPPATKPHRQADFTPGAVNTGATEDRESRVLGQAYQQNQCAGNPCSIGTHGCATMYHGSGHGCNTRHPACKHRWVKKAAKQKSRENNMKTSAGGV